MKKRMVKKGNRFTFMVYSIIQKLQLEGTLRLDAEYYQPEYLEIRKNIRSIGFFSFDKMITSFNSGRNLHQTEDNNFIKFIRTQNVRPVIIDDNGMSFTQVKEYPKLNYGDLLFVRVGEGVGNSSVVTKNFQNSTFSDNVIRVGIKNLNPFYVSVLLNSSIGSLLMKQIKKGSARSLISKENLNSLQIPKISQKQQVYFEDIVNQSEKLIIESKKIYFKAEDVLLEQLSLKDFELGDKICDIVSFSDVKAINRIDSEYFQPKYEKLVLKIKNKNAKLLSDLVVMKKGIEVGSEAYQEEGKPFFRVSNMSKHGVQDNNQQYISDDLYQKLKNNFEPKVDEILLTKDATPGVACVLPVKIGGIISGGILRLQLKKKIEPEYLALVINSVVGRIQAERDTGGSIIVHWRPEQIKNILIPILPKSTQQRIADLVQKSHQVRKKAKELLEEAKQKVEKLIEK